MSKGDSRLFGPQITFAYKKYYEVKISDSTVKRRLCDDNLFGRRPSRKPLISKKNQMARVKFAKEHLDWTKQDWNKVLWSDERKYNLFSSDGIKYVRCPKNKREDPRYTVPFVKHRGGSVMV